MAAYPSPPAFGEALLHLLLPAHAREAVSGDLLEEYREARVPAVGRVRANVWYLRQIAGIFMRAYGWFGLPLLLLLVIHDLFNTFRDASGASFLDHLPQLVLAPLSPLLAVGVFVMAGVYGSWRTRRWAGGVVATVGMFVMIWTFMAIWWNATLYPFAQVQQTNPYWINAWHWSVGRAHPPTIFGLNPDTPDGTFLQWIFWDNVGGLFFLGLSMGLLSAVCGMIGGTIAWTYRRLVPR